MGRDFLTEIKDKVVIDFGCGIGLAEKHLTDRCHFTPSPGEPADIIVALDSFEHFEDPAQILRTMHTMLKPGGCVLASFGPTWYHPYGGHLFSVFPWAHLLFSEKALLQWRSGFKTDGATRFNEVDGGLNQMTIRRFERLVSNSPFAFEALECVPIRRLKRLANPVTREFTTAIVRCKLKPR